MARRQRVFNFCRQQVGHSTLERVWVPFPHANDVFTVIMQNAQLASVFSSLLVSCFTHPPNATHLQSHLRKRPLHLVQPCIYSSFHLLPAKDPHCSSVHFPLPPPPTLSTFNGATSLPASCGEPGLNSFREIVCPPEFTGELRAGFAG